MSNLRLLFILAPMNVVECLRIVLMELRTRTKIISRLHTEVVEKRFRCGPGFLQAELGI